MSMVRQGDVLLIPVKSKPKGMQPVEPEGGRVILMRGEATGHHHSFDFGRSKARLYRDSTGGMHLHVGGTEPALLEHPEHSTIAVPPGHYEVRRQREYSPEAIRNVAD